MERQKLVELEAARGVAAVVVLVHHVLLAFFPRFHGLRFPDEAVSLYGTPLFAFVNGSAAVVVFFVLSGFVLTKGIFEQRSTARLLISAAKRWPRLVPSVFVVNVAAGALAGLHLYFNAAAAKETQSVWLGAFYGQDLGFWQHVLSAAEDGLVLTFTSAHDYYNSNLWTMYYELMGSFLALSLCGTMLVAGTWAWMIGVAAIVYSFAEMDPYFFCFPVGVLLAYAYSLPSWQRFSAGFDRLGWPGALLVLALVILAFGYHESRNGIPAAYAFLRGLYDVSPDHTRVFVHTSGAVATIVVLTCNTRLRTCLRGAGGAFLGRLSFPLYLVHLPIICSLGAAVFLALSPSLNRTIALLSASLVSVLVTVLLAFPLMKLESRWLAILRSQTDFSERGLATGFPWLRRS